MILGIQEMLTCESPSQLLVLFPICFFNKLSQVSVSDGEICVENGCAAHFQ